MADGALQNGQPQPLYFLEGHPQAGIFKGMAMILMERGFFKEAGVRANCLATNTEYCDRCTHAATQATNVAQINTERNQRLTQGTRWLG
jgi:hypothetical protein